MTEMTYDDCLKFVKELSSCLDLVPLYECGKIINMLCYLMAVAANEHDGKSGNAFLHVLIEGMIATARRLDEKQ